MINNSSRDLCRKTSSGGKVCLFLHVSQACFSSVLRNSVNFAVQFSSLTQSCPTLCDPMNYSMPGSLTSSTPRVCSNSCPSHRRCHPTISSSVIPFFSCLQSFPGSGSFPMNQFFAPGGQSIGVSASASVLPMNIWY